MLLPNHAPGRCALPSLFFAKPGATQPCSVLLLLCCFSMHGRLRSLPVNGKLSTQRKRNAGYKFRLLIKESYSETPRLFWCRLYWKIHLFTLLSNVFSSFFSIRWWSQLCCKSSDWERVSHTIFAESNLQFFQAECKKVFHFLYSSLTMGMRRVSLYSTVVFQLGFLRLYFRDQCWVF